MEKRYYEPTIPITPSELLDVIENVITVDELNENGFYIRPSSDLTSNIAYVSDYRQHSLVTFSEDKNHPMITIEGDGVEGILLTYPKLSSLLYMDLEEIAPEVPA